MQSFMRPVLVIKIAPALSFSQKFSQCTIGAAFGYGELKHANKAFCIAIVCGCSCSTHGTLEAFPQESGSCFQSSILAALVRMKESARHRKLNEFDGRDHQVCTQLWRRVEHCTLAQSLAPQLTQVRAAPIGRMIRSTDSSRSI